MEGLRMPPWARDHVACLRCGTTERQHKARGYCAWCYGQRYRDSELRGTRPAREMGDYLDQVDQEIAAESAYAAQLGESAVTTLTTVHHPDVETYAEWSSRSKVWVLVVVCPYCHQLHHHGGGSGAEPEFGHRVPHCLVGRPPDYRLVPGPPDMAKPLP